MSSRLEIEKKIVKVPYEDLDIGERAIKYVQALYKVLTSEEKEMLRILPRTHFINISEEFTKFSKNASVSVRPLRFLGRTVENAYKPFHNMRGVLIKFTDMGYNMSIKFIQEEDISDILTENAPSTGGAGAGAAAAPVSASPQPQTVTLQTLQERAEANNMGGSLNNAEHVEFLKSVYLNPGEKLVGGGKRKRKHKHSARKTRRHRRR